MIYLILTILAYCLATVIFELIPAFFLKDKKEWMKTSVICNVITNPLVNTVLLILISMQMPETFIFVYIIVAEVAVVLFERNIYEKRLNKPRKECMKFALIANLMSVLSGFLVFILHNLLIPVTSAYPRYVNPIFELR